MDAFAKSPLGYVGKDGYQIVYYGDVRTRGLCRAPAHRLTALWALRTPALLHGATVHHRDGDKLNNHISNLVFPLTAAEHQQLHHFHRLAHWRTRAQWAESRLRELEARGVCVS